MSDGASVRPPGVMWHVTITLHGQPQDPARLATSLGRLVEAHGFDVAARYTRDTVELRYWDEGQDCRGVAGHALDLWEAHRPDAELPEWPVVGLEVLDRPSFQRRWPAGATSPDLFAPGVRPLSETG